MRLRTTLVALLMSGACVAQVAPPVCAPGPGQGAGGDWANLAHYRQANVALRADSARVVFLGDSITESWQPEPFIAGNAHHVGRGIGGQTTQQLLVRFRADVINLRPRLVHIMAGTNDVAVNNGPETDTDIEDAIQSMVQLAQANHIKVLLASIPPTTDFPWRPGLNPAPRIRRLNDWIKGYARRTGVGFVNYWPALATESGAMRAELSPDGVHPNSQGYRAMQPLAQAAIAAALGAH